MSDVYWKFIKKYNLHLKSESPKIQYTEKKKCNFTKYLNSKLQRRKAANEKYRGFFIGEKKEKKEVIMLFSQEKKYNQKLSQEFWQKSFWLVSIFTTKIMLKNYI